VPLLALLISLTFASAVRAEQALSDHQQKMHDEAKAGLDGVALALTDTRAKLDAGDIAGASDAYNTAVRDYNIHIRNFGQLPGDNKSVALLRQQAKTLGNTIKETAAAVRAGQGKPREDKPVPAGAKLNYKDEQNLKDARFYLGEIEPRAKRIFELTSGAMDAEAIAESLNLMKFVHQRMGYAIQRINALPAAHPQVAAEAAKYNTYLEKLVAAQAAIEKAAPDADKQMAALGKQLNDDIAMLDSWSSSLGSPQGMFDNRPEDAIAVVGQLPQMRDAMDQMLKRWTARAADKPKDRTAADTVSKLKYVDRQLTALTQYTADLGKSLPEQIEKDLASIEQLINTAVTERRPAYFGPTGGIAQQFAFASQRVTLLKAIDASAAGASEEKIAATREKSLTAQKSLAQEIIDGNKKPAERYAGPDVEDLRKQVIATWTEAHPDKEIIAVIFNTQGWSRTTRWDWSQGSQGFNKVDYDHIQPKLFYKLDDTHAIEMPVDVYKDYMKEGRIVVKPWAVKEEPLVTQTYLLTNMK